MMGQKQNWEITGKDLGEDRVLTTFRGTRLQAELYHELMYDTEATKLQPLTIMDLDDIEFSGDNTMIEARYKGSLLVTIAEEDDKWWIYDEDEGCLKNEMEVDLDTMGRFYGFRKATTCSLCEGTGRYSIVDCSKPASSCCGGCERMVTCDCEDIEIKLER